jgi:hypothetical protein
LHHNDQLIETKFHLFKYKIFKKKRKKKSFILFYAGMNRTENIWINKKKINKIKYYTLNFSGTQKIRRKKKNQNKMKKIKVLI